MKFQVALMLYKYYSANIRSCYSPTAFSPAKWIHQSYSPEKHYPESVDTKDKI